MIHKQETSSITRPILRYHGGKWMLADWIISFFPEHRIYLEAFGGAASVLLKKRRSYAEVYNEMDGEVVNLFRVCRESPEDLINALELTPYSREDFEISYTNSNDSVERARRTIIRSFMGFASGLQSWQRTGFRANSHRSGSTAAHDWKNYPECLKQIIERLRGVVIENRNAIESMRQHDSAETLHYLDPPYKKDTRYRGKKTKVYKHEMEDYDHAELCTAANEMRGMVVLSGYNNELYNELLSGWKRVEHSALADGASPRIECLWLNQAVQSRLSTTLFDMMKDAV